MIAIWFFAFWSGAGWKWDTLKFLLVDCIPEVWSGLRKWLFPEGVSWWVEMCGAKMGTLWHLARRFPCIQWHLDYKAFVFLLTDFSYFCGPFCDLLSFYLGNGGVYNLSLRLRSALSTHQEKNYWGSKESCQLHFLMSPFVSFLSLNISTNGTWNWTWLLFFLMHE